MVRQIAWFSGPLVPRLLVAAMLVGIAYFLQLPQSILIGVLVAFLLLSQSIWRIIPWCHRKGVRHLRRQVYDKAIFEFRASYDFFRRHTWLDDWRYLVLLSPNTVSYRELALLYMAFCHSQLGDGNSSKALYEKALAQFPNSSHAKSALKMFEAASRLAEPTDRTGAAGDSEGSEE
jgi:hypothetical protein